MSRRETDATDPAGLRLPVRERLVAGLALRAYAALASPGAVLRLFRREAEQACAIAVGLDEARGRSSCVSVASPDSSPVGGTGQSTWCSITW